MPPDTLTTSGTVAPEATIAGAGTIDTSGTVVLPPPAIEALSPVHANQLANAKNAIAAAVAWLEKIPAEVEHELTYLVETLKKHV